MADEMKPAYLIHGSDVAKVDQTRARLRKRAEDEGGVASLEVFEPFENRGSPDADGLVAAIGAMSLIPDRRYLLADGIEKWGKRQGERVIGALLDAPPQTTVVLIARGKVPAEIAGAVRKVGGDVLGFDAPTGAELPHHLVSSASDRGFELDIDAARFLVSYLGEGLTRLSNELDRLAIWAGPGGRVEVDDLEEMVVDATESGRFALGDALVAGDRVRSIHLAERMLAEGKTAGSAVFSAASSVRRAHKALTMIEAGLPQNQVERGLGVPPFIAKRLVGSLSGARSDDMRRALVALADLEVWTRGGSSYPDELALDLALINATDGPG
ncbi:MAG: DNA polymerase III subunit delta [Solirubrobacterales bacterium]|nr:DNA polymerase III subunit delta [Solirubrobacterales bacterium]